MIPRLLIALGLLLALGGANHAIHGREALLSDGRIVLLALAPVDPRSLMQGDYMALRFALQDAISSQTGEGPSDGYAILSVDANGVATLVRVQDAPQPRADGEIAMRYRKRGYDIRLASDAWFFEEGSADRFATARYGEFRVADDGDALLAAMRDEAFERL